MDRTTFDVRLQYDAFASMKPARTKSRVNRIYVSNSGPFLAAWHKWEFLRRNSDYIGDYRKFVGAFGSWFERRGNWYDAVRRHKNWTKSDEAYFRSVIEPVLIRLCKKWQIFDLFSPESGFREAHDKGKVFRELIAPTGFPPESVRDYRLKRGTLGARRARRGPATRYKNLLTVTVDLNWPGKDCSHYLQRVLKIARRNYSEELNEDGAGPLVARRRFDDYDTHLEVWDLKKEGKSASEIAVLVFPNIHRDAVSRLVRDHLKAAERLISGHYKEIR